MEKKVLRHVLLFNLKEGTTKEESIEVEKALGGLKSSIPFILDLEWGSNISPEGKDNGYTYCFCITFKNEEDRDSYLVNIDHKAAAAVLEKHLDKICVVDYFTEL